MIDWRTLIFNTFWIVGAATLLAGLSYHHWLASHVGRPFREQLNQPSFTLCFWISFALICIGLAGTSQRLWETAIWIIFVVISLVNAYTTRPVN